MAKVLYKESCIQDTALRHLEGDFMFLLLVQLGAAPA